jgi:hypothetical protein
MKNDVYNNIGISVISFLSIMQKIESIEYSKTLLIMPLLLHEPLVKYLKDGRTKIRGIEDLILSKVEYFLNFNDRYINLLPLSVNTIIFAEKMGFIEITKEKIIPIKEQIKKIDFNDKKLGNRALNIYKASDNIIKILGEDVQELYFKLRIEI